MYFLWHPRTVPGPCLSVQCPLHAAPCLLDMVASQQGCQAGCDVERTMEASPQTGDWRQGLLSIPLALLHAPSLAAGPLLSARAAGPLIPSSPPFPFCPGCCVFSEKNRSVFSAGTNDKPGGPHYILRWTSPQVIKETHKPLGDWSYAYMQ